MRDRDLDRYYRMIKQSEPREFSVDKNPNPILESQKERVESSPNIDVLDLIVAVPLKIVDGILSIFLGK